MVIRDKGDVKFRVKVDLALFEAIQRDGKLSESEIARRTHISPTTVHYAMSRIKKRGFFKIKAVPCLERFPRIPKALIGFGGLSQDSVNALRAGYETNPRVMQFFYDSKSVILFVVGPSMEELTRSLFDIVECAGKRPCIHMISPKIAKCDSAIPENVLESVYSELPGKKKILA